MIRWSLNDRAFLLGDKNVEITSSANGESTLILSNWVTQVVEPKKYQLNVDFRAQSHATPATQLAKPNVKQIFRWRNRTWKETTTY